MPKDVMKVLAMMLAVALAVAGLAVIGFFIFLTIAFNNMGSNK